MADELKVGGEVDAWCTTCKLMKWHTIVAIVDGKPAKVECQGCHKQHQFRAQPPGEKPEKPEKAAKAPKARAKRKLSAEPDAPPPPDYETLLAGRAGDAKTYSANDRYAVGDVLKHPSFGVGVVAGTPAAQRIEVAFPTERKFLVHDRGAPAKEGLARPPRRDDEAPRSGTSDSPRGIK
jgi:hypothetical protein